MVHIRTSMFIISGKRRELIIFPPSGFIKELVPYQKTALYTSHQWSSQDKDVLQTVREP